MSYNGTIIAGIYNGWSLLAIHASTVESVYGYHLRQRLSKADELL